MAEYIKKETLLEVVNNLRLGRHLNKDAALTLMERAINNLPAADVVSRAAFDQVVRDRAVAMKQLKEHGIPFGGEADVVAVVRCKDCRNSMLWRKPTDTVIGECFIRKMNSEDEVFCQVGADDFCSYGERRNDNAR